MKPTKDELTQMIGYDISPQLRTMILAQVRETGKDIREIASQFVLPQMAILDDSGRFQYQDKMITPAEWEKINPLGQYGKIVVIGTKERIAKYKNQKTQ